MLTIALLVGSVLLVLVAAALIVRPEVMLFQPAPTVSSTPDEIGWPYERVELTTEDGETITGWYLEPVRSTELPRGVALYYHGNAGNIAGRLPVLLGLQELGVAVLIFDYRGYGESTGRPTVAGTLLDSEAVWNHLIDERGYQPSQIILWGRSLGGAVAIEQAARASERGTPPAALVVESSFTSTLELGAELFPLLPVRLLGKRLEYRSRERIAEVDAPILIAHSPDDDLVGFHHAEALHAASRTRESILMLAGGHNDTHASEPLYRPRLIAFLSEALR